MTAHTRPRSLYDLTDLVPLSEITGSADPKAAFARLRERWGPIAPVELEPGVPAWLVMGYREIVRVSRNDRVFSRNSANWRLAEVLQNPESTVAALMTAWEHAYYADGDRHRRLRAPVDDGVAGLNVHEVSRATQAICRELIGKFEHRGQADLVTEYAVHVPMLAVANWFGMGIDEGAQVAQAIIQVFSADKGSQDAAETLVRLLTAHMNAHREKPGDDMTTVFLRHPNLENDSEIMWAMILMLAGGYEAMISWIAQTLRVMLTDSRFSDRFRGGRLGLDDALDEVLWRNPPWTNMPGGYALSDTEVAGQPIRKGDAVILSFAAANLDPSVHSDDPWLEIGNRAHISYGTGPHVCPAHQPSRIIARIAVETVLTRLHDLRLTVPVEEITTMPSIWTMCPASLPVRFTGFS